MSELSRQGMVKATMAAIAAKEQPHWSQADMVRAAIEAYVAEVYPEDDDIGEGSTVNGESVNEPGAWVYPCCEHCDSSRDPERCGSDDASRHPDPCQSCKP